MLVLCARADRYEKCVSEQLTDPPGRTAPYHDALVHVAVVHIQADPDDAAVAHLLVVERQ